MSTTIRPAVATDLAAVERLLTESGLPVAGVAESFGDFVVAEDGGALVGVAGLEMCCDNALLRSVAVREEWRSKGVGRALVARVITEAESRGVQALYLLTTSADQWFPSFGFSRVSRNLVPDDIKATEEFRSCCPDTAVAMGRPCCVAP